MTFAECIPFLLQDKHIKRKGWKYNDLVYISSTSRAWGDSERRLIVDNYMDVLTLSDLAADDWEVVECNTTLPS